MNLTIFHPVSKNIFKLKKERGDTTSEIQVFEITLNKLGVRLRNWLASRTHQYDLVHLVLADVDEQVDLA